MGRSIKVAVRPAVEVRPLAKADGLTVWNAEVMLSQRIAAAHEECETTIGRVVQKYVDRCATDGIGKTQAGAAGVRAGFMSGVVAAIRVAEFADASDMADATDSQVLDCLAPRVRHLLRKHADGVVRSFVHGVPWRAGLGNDPDPKLALPWSPKGKKVAKQATEPSTITVDSKAKAFTAKPARGVDLVAFAAAVGAVQSDAGRTALFLSWVKSHGWAK